MPYVNMAADLMLQYTLVGENTAVYICQTECSRQRPPGDLLTVKVKRRPQLGRRTDKHVIVHYFRVKRSRFPSEERQTPPEAPAS